MRDHEEPVVSLCRYWVKPEREAEFKALLERHWPTFQKLGLVSEREPHLVFRGKHEDGRIFYVETFPWADRAAVERAHSLPEVAAVWEPMGGCCTDMTFEDVEPVAV